MITPASDLGDADELSADVVVVGAGPAGIVVALELAAAGVSVLLSESGGVTASPSQQELSDAILESPERHAAMRVAVRRQLGGTTSIWGGRCVPYDPVDFDERPFVGARWPVTFDDVADYFGRASEWCRSGRPVFDVSELRHLLPAQVPGMVGDPAVHTTSLERWSWPTDFGREFRRALETSRRVHVVTGLTCVGVSMDGEGVRGLSMLTTSKRPIRAIGRCYVLACGGLEGTRILLATPTPSGHALGDHAGHLGRWYMGHVEGIVADAHFATPPGSTICGYERDIDGTYVRRRLGLTRAWQHQQRIPNIVAWLANPALSDPEHRSGELSLAYLALRSPLGRVATSDAQRLSLVGEHVPGTPYPASRHGPIHRHLLNIARDPWSAIRFADFGARRLLKRGRHVPGFFASSKTNTYPLQYHGEHLPHFESRVTLSDQHDSLGMPRLRVDIRFTDEDVDGVVRAHREWDAYLRRAGLGVLEYRRDDVAAAVRENLGGGFHQIGTTRMSRDAGDGVVDADLAIHGVPSIYVASSSTFVTSGQANSTFMIVAFAVRLADHLRQILRR